MKRVFAISSLVLCGCGSPDVDTQPSLAPPLAAAGSGSGGAPAEGPNPLGRDRCHAPAGMGSPATIEQAVALLNALPKPTNAACFVESLDRPLTISATNSVFSAQPAASSASPRVFIKIGQLWLSIVIDGEGSELLEFGYVLPNTLRSIKGEVKFPLASALGPSDPYERLLYQGTGTICRVCHFDEQPESVPGIANVFSSVSFKPRPNTYVSTESLRIAAQSCDWHQEPTRCEMLSAVFDGGPVLEGAFPEEMPTFF